MVALAGISRVAEHSLTAAEVAAVQSLKTGGFQQMAGLASVNRNVYHADSIGFTNAENGFTIHHTIVFPGGVSAVRFAMLNQLATAFTVPKAAIASVAQVAPSVAAWTAPGVSYRPVTWSGASSVTLPARNAAPKIRASITWSDWVPVTPIARTDGGSGCVIVIRVQRPTNTTEAYSMLSCSGAQLATEYAAAGTFQFRTYSQNVDGIATPSAFTSTADSAFSLVAVAQARTFGGGSRVITAAAVGDSTTQGDPGGAPAASQGWLKAACSSATATLGLQVTPVSLAQSSANAVDYLEQAIDWVPTLRPSILFIQASSQNDPLTTQLLQESRFYQVMQLAALVKANGGLPILITPPPSGSHTLAQEANRVVMLGRVRSSGLPVMDSDAILTDYNVPSAGLARMKSTLSTDGVHPNFANGYTALASLGASAIVGAVRSS